MRTFGEFLKSLLILLVTAQVMYLFLRRTFAGKCIMMCFRITRELFRITYLTLEHTYKFLKAQSIKLKETKKQKQLSPQKKTASGEVLPVDFQAKTRKSPKPSA